MGDQVDFAGEFAVITDDVSMGASASEAESRIRLVTIINDVSMRAYVLKDLGLGFGFGMVRSKPATVFGPLACTPDELGEAWKDGRVHLGLQISRNGKSVGHPNGREMGWSFGELLSQLAYNRKLCAGLVLGSGTVSNRAYREVGSGCLAEQRAVEVIREEQPSTP